MNIPCLIHPSAGDYLGCFYFGALRNNAAVNIYVQVSVWTCVCTSPGQT